MHLIDDFCVLSMLFQINLLYLSHNFLQFCKMSLFIFAPQNFKTKIENYEITRKSIPADAYFHLFTC